MIDERTLVGLRAAGMDGEEPHIRIWTDGESAVAQVDNPRNLTVDVMLSAFGQVAAHAVVTALYGGDCDDTDAVIDTFARLFRESLCANVDKIVAGDAELMS